ncbi:MAG TPA: hypothetical protein VLY20_01530 [Nitrospiria bacterium]|nr:hypothetical protein [Nitrospiria bacterium]
MLAFFLAAVVRSSIALAAEDAPSTADTSKAAAAPKLISNPAIKVDVLDYSWKKGYTWENFNRTECTWSAKVKNNNPEARHICLDYEFLDEDNLLVFHNGKCEVIQGKSEGIITSSIMVQSRLVDDVKKSTVIPLEAHPLHSFVPVPPVAPQ